MDYLPQEQTDDQSSFATRDAPNSDQQRDHDTLLKDPGRAKPLSPNGCGKQVSLSNERNDAVGIHQAVQNPNHVTAKLPGDEHGNATHHDTMPMPAIDPSDFG